MTTILKSVDNKIRDPSTQDVNIQNRIKIQELQIATVNASLLRRQSMNYGL